MVMVWKGQSGVGSVLTLMATLALGGCLSDDDTQATATNGMHPRAGQTQSATGGSNSAPTISGTAPAKVSVGQQYSFTPRARDPDGDPLSFEASGVPDWLSFDDSTGRLAGRPSEADVASYRGIRITVSDGQDSASVDIAGITVVAESTVAPGATGSASISWDPPTLNVDGSALTDLAGYRIRYGTNPGELDRVVELSNAGLTTYVFDNLAAATWYFAISAVNSQGVESLATGLIWTTIG
jgi:hypothetical protein